MRTTENRPDGTVAVETTPYGLQLTFQRRKIGSAVSLNNVVKRNLIILGAACVVLNGQDFNGCIKSITILKYRDLVYFWPSDSRRTIINPCIIYFGKIIFIFNYRNGIDTDGVIQ